MRDRTIVIGFFSILIIVGMLISGSIFGVLAGIIALFVVGIVWVLTQNQPRAEEHEAITRQSFVREETPGTKISMFRLTAY